MKHLSFLTILSLVLVFSINAQVMEQATVAWIKTDTGGGADPFLCVFANTPNDVTLLYYVLNVDNKPLRGLNQPQEFDLHEMLAREMTIRNARLLALHIVQRKVGESGIITYFHVRVFERIGDKYYLVASNE